MGRNRPKFVTGEIYHIFNRGVEKRDIFKNSADVRRFFESMVVFNTTKPIGSLRDFYEFQEIRKANPSQWSDHWEKREKLVEFIAYCLNPNHKHLVVMQRVDGGVSELMKRLGGGYTRYFNDRYERTGALFQGKFKAVHIATNEQLLHVSAYVNLNYRVHRYPQIKADLTKSSWSEYVGECSERVCNKDIVLDQFKNTDEYKQFSLSSLQEIIERRYEEKEEEDEVGRWLLR